jgi:hypothetical protein
MIIHSEIKSKTLTYKVEYHDANTFNKLPVEQVTQAYGVCFYNNKLVIGFGGHKNGWGLIGGTIEHGENFLDTLKREVKEEANMAIITALPIGYQIITEPTGREIYQLRYSCKVKPYGNFEKDPAGGITAIKLIVPKLYKKYFNWGEIGDRLISRGYDLYRSKLIKSDSK